MNGRSGRKERTRLRKEWVLILDFRLAVRYAGLFCSSSAVSGSDSLNGLNSSNSVSAVSCNLSYNLLGSNCINGVSGLSGLVAIASNHCYAEQNSKR